MRSQFILFLINVFPALIGTKCLICVPLKSYIIYVLLCLASNTIAFGSFVDLLYLMRSIAITVLQGVPEKMKLIFNSLYL